MNSSETNFTVKVFISKIIHLFSRDNKTTTLAPGNVTYKVTTVIFHIPIEYEMECIIDD